MLFVPPNSVQEKKDQQKFNQKDSKRKDQEAESFTGVDKEINGYRSLLGKCVARRNGRRLNVSDVGSFHNELYKGRLHFSCLHVSEAIV